MRFAAQLRSPKAAIVFASLAAVGLAILLGVWSSRTWNYQPDEVGYRGSAGNVWPGLPHSLWDSIYGRGVQRLTIWIWGIALHLFGAVDGFRVTRWIYVVVYCSTAVPVWLWVRQMKLSAWWAALAALLAILVPWAVVTSSFLTESVAYPASAWALLAIWRSAVRPTVWADLLALVLVGVAALARTALLDLFVVLVATYVIQDLRWNRPDTGAWWRRIVSALLHLPRRHPVTAAAVVAGFLILVFAGATGLEGNYSAPGPPRLDLMWKAALHVVAVLSVGVGVLPAVLAFALAGSQLVRSRDPDLFAISLILLWTLLAVMWTVQLAGVDERYLMFLAPPVLVAFVAAVGRQAVRWPAVVLAGVAVGLVVAHAVWRPDLGPYGYFASSAETFMARVLQQGLPSHLPGPLDRLGSAMPVLVVGLATVLAVALVAVRRAEARPWLIGGVAVVLLGAGLAQTTYVTSKFSKLTGGPPLTQRAWLGPYGDGEQTVGAYDVDVGPDAQLSPAWIETHYFHTARFVSIADSKINPVTGLVQRPPGAPPVPTYVVVPRLSQSAPLAGQPVASAPTIPLDLLRVTRPARARWLMTGVAADGWIELGHTARIRVFAAATPAGARCFALTVIAPGSIPVQTVRVRSADARPRTVRVAAGSTTPLKLPFTMRGPYAQFNVTATGDTTIPDGRRVSVDLSVGGPVACPAPGTE